MPFKSTYGLKKAEMQKAAEGCRFPYKKSWTVPVLCAALKEAQILDEGCNNPLPCPAGGGAEAEAAGLAPQGKRGVTRRGLAAGEAKAPRAKARKTGEEARVDPSMPRFGQPQPQTYYAPKLEVLMRNIEQLDAADSQQLDAAGDPIANAHLLYSNTLGVGGAEMVGGLLLRDVAASGGWNRVLLKPVVRGGKYVLVWQEPGSGEEHPVAEATTATNATVLQDAYWPYYAELDGVLYISNSWGNSTAENQIINALMLHAWNERFLLARYIVLDPDFKEGVDVFWVAYIHLFAPLPTLNEMLQAIGRGLRRCGQQNLPFRPGEGWQVQVFVYATQIGLGTTAEQQSNQADARQINIGDALIQSLYSNSISSAAKMWPCKYVPVSVPPAIHRVMPYLEAIHAWLLARQAITPKEDELIGVDLARVDALPKESTDRGADYQDAVNAIDAMRREKALAWQIGQANLEEFEKQQILQLLAYSEADAAAELDPAEAVRLVELIKKLQGLGAVKRAPQDWQKQLAAARANLIQASGGAVEPREFSFRRPQGPPPLATPFAPQFTQRPTAAAQPPTKGPAPAVPGKGPAPAQKFAVTLKQPKAVDVRTLADIPTAPGATTVPAVPGRGPAVTLKQTAPAKTIAPCALPPNPQPQAFLRAMRSLYNDDDPEWPQGLAFPQWVAETQPSANQLAATRVYTTVYTEEIGQLLRQREPVVIGKAEKLKRPYNRAGLESCFGWKTSAYQQLWDDSVKQQQPRLPPNFSIYTLASLPTNWNAINCRAATKPEMLTDVHLLHAIGLAFDSPEQPDHQYYIQRNHQDQVRAFYWQLFAQVFQCAYDLQQAGQIDHLVMSLVGGGSFADLYADPGGQGRRHFQATIWAPTFVAARNMWNPSIPVVMMGKVESPEARAILDAAGIQYDAQLFPAIVRSYPDALFVNAWDPHSMIGNGNCADNSLDGWVGRTTNAVALGWPLSNPAMQQQEVLVVKLPPMPQ